uniref:Zinc finger protein 862 n=1 Tax=Romanomermis culicivorax TaxID=13658 RepID=A0A915KIS0_ROMCU
LLPLPSKDAASISQTITHALEKDGLKLTNLVGIGCDGASVLTGRRSGVFTRLKEHQPHLVMVRCICHSLHIAALRAIDELPKYMTE